MKDILDTSTREALATKVFADSFKATDVAMLDSREWDLSFILKEVREVVRDLIEKVEESDVVRRYDLALRLNALTAVHLMKLLESDARGEFDNKPIALENTTVEDFHDVPA